MSLYALTVAGDISAAYALYSRHLETGGEIVESTVGYQGGNEPAALRWFPDLQFWAMLQPERLPGRYWAAFGVDDPHASSLLSITCEINPPHSGIDRLCAGVFVRSRHGGIYLAHSGRVGGGRSGIGKNAFLRFYGDETVDTVTWPDGQTGSYIIISAIDDIDLHSNIAGFVHKVAQFKKK